MEKNNLPINSTIKDKLHVRIDAVESCIIIPRTTKLQQKKQVAEFQLEKNANEGIIEHVSKNKLLIQKSGFEINIAKSKMPSMQLFAKIDSTKSKK